MTRTTFSFSRRRAAPVVVMVAVFQIPIQAHEVSKIREHWQIDGWLSEIVAVIVSLPAPSSFPPSLESTTTRWSRDYLGTSLLTLSFPSFRPYPNPAYYTLFALPWVRISGIGMMMLVTMIMATTDQTHKNKHCTERRRRRSAATRATIIVGGVA
ncbi:hypothetical protein B0T09DRAFT_188940 [Sordaria sp. MPI-SDFR-AT-0083]|nr:hypothetical protein B0T09DRAFT_188940 [Sordaria sp. MPI-SDFR-AT-0083]